MCGRITSILWRRQLIPDFLAGHATHVPPEIDVDRVFKELHRAIAHQRVDAARMTAYVAIRAGAGGQVGEVQIRQALERQGVTAGIDEASLARIVERAGGEEVSEVLVAQGREPVHESGNKLHFHAAVVMGRSFLVKEGGAATNYVVQEGEEIAEILKPSRPPVDGFDLTGAVLAAKRAPALAIKLGVNVRRVEADGGRVTFVAEKGGEVFYDGNTLEIKDTLAVPGDVDAASGHIDFAGSVRIKGSVADGYKVVAGGDLTVEQNIGRSLLSSEGSIDVGGGVKGAGKAILRSKNTVRSTYVEEATILAVGDIHIKNSCLRCQIRCNSRLHIDGEKAGVAGGRIKTKRGLETGNLGASAGAPTEVSFGQDYLVEDQIGVAERALETIKAQVERIDAWLAAHGGDAPGVRQVREKKLAAAKLLEQRGIRLFNLRETYESHFPSDVVVRGTLYPGVVFESHGRTLTIEKEHRAVLVTFDEQDGRIKISPMAGD